LISCTCGSVDAFQHRSQLIRNRRPAVRLLGQLPDVLRRLSEGLLHVLGSADGVDRRLHHVVRKFGVTT
jgi:hypothetical protein